MSLPAKSWWADAVSDGEEDLHLALAFAEVEVDDVQEEAVEEASWQAMARAVATPPISIYSTVAEKEEAAIAELAGEFDTDPVDYKFVAAVVAPSFLEEGTASAGNTTDSTDNFADVGAGGG